MSYLIRHNATKHGNDTYLIYSPNQSRFFIDIPSGCSGSILTVSIAAVNVLGTSEWAIAEPFEIAPDSSCISSMCCQNTYSYYVNCRYFFYCEDLVSYA